MDMRTVFPSRFFRVEDLNPSGTLFTIGNVMMEQVMAEWKPVMYFRGQEKGLVINQTNNKILMGLPGFGPESNGWVGKDIVLFVYHQVQNGQPQPRIGVRSPDTSKGGAPAGAVAQPTPVTDYSKPHPANRPLKDEMNDDLPF